MSLTLALPQMLVEKGGNETSQRAEISPWRTRKKTITASIISQGLVRTFSNVAVRSFWDRKRKKFKPPGNDYSDKKYEDFLKSA